MDIKPIAHIITDLETKFGVPRQSGVATHFCGRIVMEKEYRVKEAFRGLQDFSHIWLLWDFSEAHRNEWSPTVRPPRLGGNKRIGVFATRSPFRPNNIGLSSVKLLSIDYEAADGPILYVEGVDLMNGTPIYDIKPYLRYTDSHSDAIGGFVDMAGEDMFRLEVVVEHDVFENFDDNQILALKEIIANDPRPHYQTSDERKVYRMSYGGKEVEFLVKNNKAYVRMNAMI